jgi:uncharacterized repeat protein (TIGR01451 family)
MQGEAYRLNGDPEFTPLVYVPLGQGGRLNVDRCMEAKVLRFKYLAILGLFVLAAGLFFSADNARANPDLEAIDEIDCVDDFFGSDAASDEAAADALQSQGFSCTSLLNKGQLPGNFQEVGQLWYKLSGNVLQMRIIIFGKSNTDISGDNKLCLDDDPNPINNIAPGGLNPNFCEGGDAASSFQQGGNNGPSYPPAKACDVAPEEPPGKMEIVITNIANVPVDPDGAAGPGGLVGGWNVNIDSCTEVLPHFNSGGFSIVAYFQPVNPPNITISKTPDNAADVGGTIAAGADATFTITVTNSGSGAASNVDIDDTLPGSNWSIVSADKANPAAVIPFPPVAGEGCSISGASTNVLHCDVAMLAAGQSIVVVVKRTTSLADCTGTNATVTIDNGKDTASTADDATAGADGLADVTDPGQIIMTCPGHILIEKRSVKKDLQGNNVLVTDAGTGAIFFVDDDDADSDADFAVRDNNDNTVGNGAATPPADVSDQNNTFGLVCVKDLIPGKVYTVNEVTPPTGYGAATQTNLNATAQAGDCSTTPTGAAVVTFINPPLFDVQVNFRDAGSGETSAFSIDCVATSTTNTTSITPPTGWVTPNGASETTEDVAYVPNGGVGEENLMIINCTIKVDP